MGIWRISRRFRNWFASPPAPLLKRPFDCAQGSRFRRGEKYIELCSPSPDDALGFRRQERGPGGEAGSCARQMLSYSVRVVANVREDADCEQISRKAVPMRDATFALTLGGIAFLLSV